MRKSSTGSWLAAAVGVALALATVSVGLLAGAASKEGRPRELGLVDWESDLDAALDRARRGGDSRPLFVLFQEVPGCATCVSFGEQVLSHPLLVEAVETEFVPIFVYNNRSGRDAEILARYQEPSWNNPVVRLLGSDGGDLIPRKAGVWTPHAMGQRMIASLEGAGRPVPDYLRAAVDETRPRATERATFGMYCYWSGEACLGGVPGIQSSRTGAVAGVEVVEVHFDPSVLSYQALLDAARSRGCAERVFAHDEAQLRAAREVFGRHATLERGAIRPARESDQKYYLGRSSLRALRLTPRQALRVNSALEKGSDPLRHLSPRQRRELEESS